MMLSLDIQLLAKNLWMTPNLCRIAQTVSVLISKIKLLHTETTLVLSPHLHPGILALKGGGAAGHCSQLCCFLASRALLHPSLLAGDPLLRVLPANLTSDSILGVWGD